MLINALKLQDCPVISMHMGGIIARTKSVVIDPHELKIVACEVEGGGVTEETGDFLEMSMIREFSPLGMIIDSSDDFTNYGEVFKLDEVIDMNYEIIGKKVVTKKGSKLGKVIGYNIDTTDYSICQLIIQRPALKSFIDPELLISRSEIESVDDTHIIIKHEESEARKTAASETFTPNFVNPFRKQTEPDYATTDNQTPDELDS